MNRDKGLSLCSLVKRLQVHSIYTVIVDIFDKFIMLINYVSMLFKLCTLKSNSSIHQAEPKNKLIKREHRAAKEANNWEEMETWSTAFQ